MENKGNKRGGFQMKSRVAMDNTPIYTEKLPNDTYGLTLNTGNIIVNSNLKGKQKDQVIKHEKVHVNQIQRGDLSYTDSAVFWKGKKHNRSSMDEGNKNLPWEKEAYSKSKK